MKKLNYSLAGAGIVLFILNIILAYIPSNDFDSIRFFWYMALPSFILLIPVSLLVGLIFLLRDLIIHKRIRWIYLSPAAIQIAFSFIIIVIGYSLYNSITDAMFKRNIPRYMKMVQKIETGQIESYQIIASDNSKNNYMLSLPAHFPAKSIRVIKEAKSNFEIIFFQHGMFTLQRQGYVYLSNDKFPSQDSMVYRKRIMPHWYKWMM